MQPQELSNLLEKLIARWENEVIEFKEAQHDYKTDEIGKYFSALSNASNLHNSECGWLVFGVNNKTKKIVGTNYRTEEEELQKLKHQITQSTEPSTTFRSVHTFRHKLGRVLLFEVPSAPRGIPIAWKGHYYSRSGESLTSLSLDQLDFIRNQTLQQDWSAQLAPNACLDDLNTEALTKARSFFALKHANRFNPDEVLNWSLETFLDRAKITQNGRITNTALLLLGKSESAHLLSPHPAQITWKLEGIERAYAHFYPPFLLATTKVYQRIRNIQLRLLPNNQLLPYEIAKYDQKMILEALHNCIAHQNYRQNGRVIVTENTNTLIFENLGNFYEGQPDDYVLGKKTPRAYRNPFLAQAMVNLNMIDTMGYGIHQIYSGQMARYLPLPDYDLSEPDAVKMTLYGGVVDPMYTEILMQKTNIPLLDVLALDRVQKKLSITDESATHLRKAKLIEGRKPKYFVSAAVAKITGTEAEYIHIRGQDDAFYTKLITDYLDEFGHANRNQINNLLTRAFSNDVNNTQKEERIDNLLTKLRRNGIIQNTGTRAQPKWQRAESST